MPIDHRKKSSRLLVEYAAISWHDGQPLSNTYDDVYFSRHDGLAESRHVFLQGNRLSDRFNILTNNKTHQFTIAETGFGTGLNFLAAWHLWRQCDTGDAQLHYISVENRPLNLGDLQKALSLWPELSELGRQLIDQYPVAATVGFHRLNFFHDSVHLTLIFDDAVGALRQCRVGENPNFPQANFAGVDAWFLDGFAPGKNPAMWGPELLSMIAALSKTGTTLATYSVAGKVRRDLQSQGFEVTKKKGFADKREMLSACLTDYRNTTTAQPEQLSNRFTSPHPVPWDVIANRPSAKQKTALIIGAGLAGCHTARALARRNWKVIVLEKQDDVAQGASGNSQGVVYAKLSADNDALAQFNLAALEYALQIYWPFWRASKKFGCACGTMHATHREKDLKLLEQLENAFTNCGTLIQFLDSSEAANIAGVEIEHPCYFIRRSGWINPPQLCRALVDHANINVQCGSPVAQLNHDNGLWHAHIGNGDREFSADVAIIANANDASNFSQCNHLPFKALRGQVSTLKNEHCIDSINTVICADGYVIPTWQGQQSFGATFTLNNHEPIVSNRDHRDNLDKLKQLLPGLHSYLDNIHVEDVDGRTGFRCTTPDYLPVVGQLPDIDFFKQHYRPLSKNANADINIAGRYLPNLLINAGHGSRGLAYTPLCAELIASLITNTPLPVSQSLATALNPARFIVRDLIRNRSTVINN